jgi:hypothetical protein
VAIAVNEQDGGSILEVRVTGTLTKEDYQHFVPEVERLIDRHGKLRVLFDMHDFHGWSAGALWEDIKFDMKHFRDIDRLALVGERKWEAGMAGFCRPFTTAAIRYFDRAAAEDARRWLRGE